jgi:hypothetical protein
MTRCPSCGTHNPDSRKACSRCGKALPQTEIKCPECGTLNPVGNILCDRCNARLIPSSEMIPPDVAPSQGETDKGSSLRGISLPSRAGSSEGTGLSPADFPDWMLDLPAVDSPLAGGEQPPDVGGSEAGYADWLSDLFDEGVPSAEASEAPDADDLDLALEPEQLPDWLSSEPEVTASAPMDQDAEEDLPDWLRSISDQLGPLGEDESEPVEPVGTSVPDWLAAPVDEANTFAENESRESSDVLPDWLTGGQMDALEREDMDTDQAPSSQNSLRSESLDWLFTQENPEEGSAGVEIEDNGTSSDSELPDWLAAAQIEDQEEAMRRFTTIAAPQEPADPAGQPVDEVVVEIPDWLANMATIEENVSEELEVDAAPLPETAAEAEVPDWLMALSQAEEVEDSAPPRQPASEQPASEQAASEQAVSEQPASEQPASEQPAPEQKSDEPDETAVQPDWLSEIGAVASPTGSTSAVFTYSSSTIEEASPEPDSPSWLEDAAADQSDLAPAASVPAFVTDAIVEEPLPEEDEPVEEPEWLQDLPPSSPDEPEDLSQVGAALDRADLPAWLENLRPPEAGGALGRGRMPDMDALIPADIPDWVQAMRPLPGEQGRGTRDGLGWATLAEPEGPLAGLPGVLQGLALVDMPPETRRGSDYPIPEAVVKQAQLWQHLLEQPRSAERPITQTVRRFRSSALVRTLVSLALLAGLLAAILFFPENLALSQATPLQMAPGATALARSLDRIQPGQRVLVALEYTPAYADEISQIARPILEHLDDLQAQLLIVSTTPEGTGLGLGLIADVRYEGDVLEVGYLPGDFNGIASFLETREGRSAEYVMVLTSQSDRLRWWVEQVALVDSQSGSDLPLSAGVTASARPLVTPYLQADGVEGWIAGFSGGLAYREARGEELTGFYARTWDVLMLGHWFVAALLFAGVLYSLIAGKKGAH